MSYIQTAGDTKAPQVWNGDVATVVADPDDRGCLASKFFVGIAWVFRLPNLVGQRKPNKNPRAVASVIDVDGYTDIEAPMDPLLDIAQAAVLVLVQT